jgi:hypothetical protein
MANRLLCSIFLILSIPAFSRADYTFKVTVKHPFLTSPHYYYDSLTNNLIVISDSSARFIPVKLIIYNAKDESLCQERHTNDFGYTIFTFDKWKDEYQLCPRIFPEWTSIFQIPTE